MSDEALWLVRMVIGNDNPFSDAYVKQQIRWYGKKVLHVASNEEASGLVLRILNPRGPLPDFFNKNFRLDETLQVPTLFLDGTLWMSLTPMEIQSQFLAINKAEGDVGVAGLGMGYAALRMAQKDDVSAVTVFEQDQRVIDYFKQFFSRRKGFSKIKYVFGDAREELPKHQFDFLYVDIYPTLLCDEVVSDTRLFKTCVTSFPEGYHFWGQERVFVDAVLAHDMMEGGDLSMELRALLTLWQATPVSLTDKRLTRMMLCDMYYPVVDREFVEQVFDVLGVDY